MDLHVFTKESISIETVKNVRFMDPTINDRFSQKTQKKGVCFAFRESMSKYLQLTMSSCTINSTGKRIDGRTKLYSKDGVKGYTVREKSEKAKQAHGSKGLSKREEAMVWATTV